jgi:SAM-dependent methyltransferase
VHAPQTWHHGLVAEYWATVNLDAPEVELYRPYLQDPILDAGCGAGRLLAPLRELGYDVDGCDASPDMVERARRRAPDATLWVSPLHELDPPRRYATIVVCGVFGLGSSREQDEQAVARLHDALVPGGTLILDNEESDWSRWHVRGWNEPSDGDIRLSSRVDLIDDEDRCVHMTIRAETADGRLEEHALTMRMWTQEALLRLLERNGFVRVEVKPGVDERIVVYVASRDGDLQPLPR